MFRYIKILRGRRKVKSCTKSDLSLQIALLVILYVYDFFASQIVLNILFFWVNPFYLFVRFDKFRDRKNKCTFNYVIDFIAFDRKLNLKKNLFEFENYCDFIEMKSFGFVNPWMKGYCTLNYRISNLIILYDS
jgi:hypothetical protein